MTADEERRARALDRALEALERHMNGVLSTIKTLRGLLREAPPVKIEAVKGSDPHG